MASTTNLYEKLHVRMCRSILCVNNRTSALWVYGELGRYPLYVNIIQCKLYIDYVNTDLNNSLSDLVAK